MARQREYIEQQYYAEQLEQEQEAPNESEPEQGAGTGDGREG
jgi:hypothetical protein